MSIVEREHEEWTGEERRTTRPAERGHARRRVADYGVLAFAATLVLAEFAWLSFLAYLVARALV